MRRLRPLVPTLVLLAAAVSVTFMPGGGANAAPTPLSQGRPATASSTEGPGMPPSGAFDGNLGTRWASAQQSDQQWLRVDLGSVGVITQVVLRWESAYARAYQVQTSADDSVWTTVKSVTNGAGGVETWNLNAAGRYVRLLLTQRGTGYGYSLWEFEVNGTPGPPPAGGPGYVPANPVVTATPSTANPPHRYFHEFQANCSVTRDLPDDPIVYPGLPGASHMHTFMGNTTTTGTSTVDTLRAGGTSCVAPGDRSGYWMPTMYNGNTAVTPIGPQVIYYKTGVRDYTSVRPFPVGLRFVVGSVTATPAQFLDASVEGWECGESFFNADFPATCPANTQVNVRYQAPSCWDGRFLDTPDHKSHMAYPVDDVCPTSHPVAVPMIEFKMAFPVSGNLSQLRLSSGRGYSFHYDFFNVWDTRTLTAMVGRCINQGYQCNARGYDETYPSVPPVLNDQYILP